MKHSHLVITLSLLLLSAGSLFSEHARVTASEARAYHQDEAKKVSEQTKKPTLKENVRIPDGSKFFVATMEGELHTFISAELIKKKLPIVVVTDESTADYIISGANVRGDDKWYHTVFGGKDKNEGSIQVISVKDKVMIWAGEAGDRSLWWGNLKRGGRRRVADRLVDKMKKDLFKN